MITVCSNINSSKYTTFIKELKHQIRSCAQRDNNDVLYISIIQYRH